MSEVHAPPGGPVAGTDHEPTLTEDLDAARGRHPGWNIRVSAETGRIWCTLICADTSGLTTDCGDVRQVDHVIAEAEHIAAMRARLTKAQAA